MSPRVSVCIPTYNRATTLKKTIDAVLRQTFEDWEIIVCDDASTDDTEQVVRAFDDSRIQYFRNESNLGLYPNWNRCIGLASGDYVAIFHDHDIYLPSIVECSVAFLDKYPSSSFVHSALLFISEEDILTGVDVRPFPELMSGKELVKILVNRWDSPIMAATALVKRSAYEQVGGYNYERYGIDCDMNMWFRLGQIGDVAYVNKPQALIRTRKKGDSTSVFRWSNVSGSLNMRRDHLEIADHGNGFHYYLNKLKFLLQRDIRMITVGIRAILLESDQVAKEGKTIIKEDASSVVNLLTELVQDQKILQILLRRFFLPQHYKKITQYQAEKEQELLQYLENNKELKAYLSDLINYRNEQ